MVKLLITRSSDQFPSSPPFLFSPRSAPFPPDLRDRYSFAIFAWAEKIEFYVGNETFDSYATPGRGLVFPDTLFTISEQPARCLNVVPNSDVSIFFPSWFYPNSRSSLYCCALFLSHPLRFWHVVTSRVSSEKFSFPGIATKSHDSISSFLLVCIGLDSLLESAHFRAVPSSFRA